MKSSVVLINPPFSLQERYGKDMKKFGAVSEPLGIAYIASYLESQSIAVRIIDAQAENLNIVDVVENVLGHKDDIIGISVLTPAFGAAQKLCRALKTAFPNGMIVLGGPHCSALPERTLNEIPESWRFAMQREKNVRQKRKQKKRPGKKNWMTGLMRKTVSVWT